MNVIKKIIAHIPVISKIYASYCSLRQQLSEQKKTIEKLRKLTESQNESIKKLLSENENKNVQINRLNQSFDRIDREIGSVKSATDEKFRKKDRQVEELYKGIRNAKTATNEQLKKKGEQIEELYKGVRDIKLTSAEQARKQKEYSKDLYDQVSERINKERDNNKKRLQKAETNLNRTIRHKYFQSLHRDDYKEALENWLYESIGEVADLDNPKTFNEKIQWMKLRADREPYTTLADKYKVRDWVSERIGEQYLIPLIGVWDKFEDIDFDALPERFVLKANHGCKYNYIVRDKSIFDYADAKAKFDKWMKENFAWNSLELQYKNIPKKIIAEEYIENTEENLNDYKIFCFNGKPKYIAYYTERKDGLKMAMFDLEWNLQPFTSGFPQYKENVEKPQCLDEMIRLAEVLAEGFPHVRVDFYVLNDGSIKFGEMTFTTSSGACKWNPSEYNRILGDMIDLPEA